MSSTNTSNPSCRRQNKLGPSRQGKVFPVELNVKNSGGKGEKLSFK